MSDPLFLPPATVLTLADVIALTGARAATSGLGLPFFEVAALATAGPRAITFRQSHDDAVALAKTRAGACFVEEHHASSLPLETVALITPTPREAIARVIEVLHPGAHRPASMFATRGVNPAAFLHPEARLETGVVVDPGVVIGPKAEIGTGTVIGANAVIGPDVRIGRHCAIGAHVTIVHALIGNGVVIGPGARIGQNGVAEPVAGEDPRLPGLGRVIVQDDVDIGANATIDRGGFGDTVIGDGSRVGNLAHIERDRVIPRRSRV